MKHQTIQEQTASLESVVKWAIDKKATSIFIACINKIQKKCIKENIDFVEVVAIAANRSNLGHFDYIMNESHCNLFRAMVETIDGEVHIKRYKTWSESISEFIEKIKSENYIEEDETERIEKVCEEIRNTRVPIRIQSNESTATVEVETLNNQITDLSIELTVKDNEIESLNKTIEDYKTTIEEYERMKQSLKDFLQ